MKKHRNILYIVVAFVVILGAAVILLLNKDNGKVVGDPATKSQIQPNNQSQSGDQRANAAANKERQRYVFEYNGVVIGINDPSEPVLEALGEPMSYFEAPSCAFEGLDKIYSYNSFEFQTYTKDGKDYISSVIFLDDSVTTTEGITLSAPLEEVNSVYGSGYTQSFNQYTYTDGNCDLSFLIENNEVVAIEYALTKETSGVEP